MFLRLENRLLFHPMPHTVNWQPAAPDLHAEDVWLRAAAGTRLHAWWCPTDNWEPGHGALLYCHGNACNLSHRADTIRGWQQLAGKAVLIFDYPGYGFSEGKPSEAGCYAVADAACDWLIQEKRISPEHLLLYGSSLGAGVAIDLAGRRPHAALLLLSAFASLPAMARTMFPWTPLPWLVSNRFDNLGKIGRCRRPVFVAHGTADRLVPLAHSERLFAAANEPKRFFPMPGYDHNHAPGPEFYRAVRDFLTALDKGEAHLSPH